MKELKANKRTILQILSPTNAKFVIPDYQRPYAWKIKECEQLWDDVFQFAIPDADASKFNQSDEYFLGSIVTYNDNGVKEVIDGQQRLTTTLLLLRAFYKSFDKMQDKSSTTTRSNIEKCIWEADEFDNIDDSSIKIDSQVANDDDKDEFLNIILTGEVNEKSMSRYAINYRFFKDKVNKFKEEYPAYIAHLPNRFMKNCVILDIEAEDVDTALTIFSTLNNRGLQLSDSDIFKSQFYRYYKNMDRKKEFMSKWQKLETTCNAIFTPIQGTPVDELFTRYMYYARAKANNGEQNFKFESMRQFYGRNSYDLLKKEETLEDLIDLYTFWNDVDNQNTERFSDDALKRLFVLHYAPNSMWLNIVSVYFLVNRINHKEEVDELDNEKFCTFLDKIIAFVWAYGITNPGVTAVRTPILKEINKIINGQDVDFAEYKFDRDHLTTAINNYIFNNSRSITKSMLTWWAFQNKEQQLIKPLNTVLEIEHMYPKRRYTSDNGLSSASVLESLGNKSILEKRINIRASDYTFKDKAKYYNGYFIEKRNQHKEATTIHELIQLSNNKTDFTEEDINDRRDSIISEFIKYVAYNGLVINCNEL